MKFKIKTVDAQGTYNEDIIEAGDNSALYNEIRQKGLTLISADEVVSKVSESFFTLNYFFSRIKIQEKINFAKNLSAMIDAGLPMSRALSVIEKQSKHSRFKQIIANLNKSLAQGKTLSESMREYANVFPSIMTSMVRAGEESGSLSQSLRMVALQMDNAYKLTRKIRGAMMYPCIILFAMIIIGFFMLTYVVPTLAATFKEFKTELPATTKIVIGLSDFFKAHFIVSILVMVVSVVGIYLLAKTKNGKRALDYLMLHLPIVGNLTIEINSARTARTLSSLLSAGVEIVVATRITADVLQNSYYKEVMVVVEQKIQKGEPIAQVFAEKNKLYPAFVSEMISVGEETGQLSQMLLGIANFYEEDVDQKTKDMSSVIEPLLMVFIGLAVGFFAISMISPIYSLSSSIS